MNFQLAPRTKRHPLSKIQITTLLTLSDHRTRYGSNVNGSLVVVGTAAAALERRGLVAWCLHGYYITPAGLRRLKEI